MGATHAKAWMRVRGAQLYAVISGDERKLAGDLSQVGGNLGGDAAVLDFSAVKKYRSFEEALADAEIDAFDLCVPTDRHAEWAIAALRAGKHVLVEKPLALTVEDAQRVETEARVSGRVLMAAQVLRFMPAYVEARKRIRRLGPVRSAAFYRRCAAPKWSAWMQDAERSGGGAFDLLIHDVDYVRWLFGMPRSIQATGASDRERGLDTVSANLEYPGCAVTVAGGWFLKGEYPFSMAFTMACEEGVLDYAGGVLTEYRNGASAETVTLPDYDPFEAELSHFHECAVRNAASKICPVSESVEAVWLMLAILDRRDQGSGTTTS
jgi:predicted dehydrogenase